MTKEEALKIFNNPDYFKNFLDKEKFWFQVNEPMLCMPFGEFKRCAEVALKRPVYTHEFANAENLRSEYRGLYGQDT